MHADWETWANLLSLDLDCVHVEVSHVYTSPSMFKLYLKYNKKKRRLSTIITDRKGKVMFSQVFVSPQSASWLLVHCSALLWRGRYASYRNAFLFFFNLYSRNSLLLTTPQHHHQWLWPPKLAANARVLGVKLLEEKFGQKSHLPPKPDFSAERTLKIERTWKYVAEADYNLWGSWDCFRTSDHLKVPLPFLRSPRPSELRLLIENLSHCGDLAVYRKLLSQCWPLLRSVLGLG